MTPGTLLYYHGPDPSWRGGWRLCVVVKVWRQWARLVDVGTLVTYGRVNLSDLERCRVLEDDDARAHTVGVMVRRQKGYLGTLTPYQHMRAGEIIDACGPTTINADASQAVIEFYLGFATRA